MAAVRRSSDSGLIVALVIFVVLMFAGLGCAIWFYQQRSLTRQALVANQGHFETTIAQEFRNSGWPALTSDAGSELGVTYGAAAFGEVQLKLQDAAEYEELKEDVLGWESMDSVLAAIAESPLQKASTDAGRAGYGQLRLLLDDYEDTYTDLLSREARLTADNAALQAQLVDAQQTIVTTRRDLEARNNQAGQKFNQDVAKLRADFNDMSTRHDRQRQEAVAWQQKHEQEVQARRGEAAKLLQEVALWRKRYEDAVRPPGEGRRLVAAGEIIKILNEEEMVIIQGGQDVDVRENQRFVVYEETPDGGGRKKGMLLVAQVNGTTSVASIAEEVDYILEGDYFISLATWTDFQRRTGRGG